MTTGEKYPFKAEIQQLLHILVHSLYKDREIFLRELISNASDALVRLQFEMLTNPDVLDPEVELAIYLSLTEENGEKTLIVRDTGIGMTAVEMAQNLGTIAQSGAREFMDSLKDGQGTATEIIGRFGVGFYSVYMVAQNVRVVSRSYRPTAEPAAWVCDGSDSFRLESADKADRGTEIHILFKADAAEIADPGRLQQIIHQHSDYINFPIYLEGRQINQRQSLWRKIPAEVSEDDYTHFYQQMTLDMAPPLAHIHFTSDSPVDVRALLFIPTTPERPVFSMRKEPGVKLYSNNVMIQEYCKDLLPEWLAFVDGVVDSEALPLNVSRETVQNNRLVRQLGRTIYKRVLRTLTHLGDNEPDKYAAFWQAFNRYLKEGVARDPASIEDIQPLLRFTSSKSDGQLTALATYVGRMAEGQPAIYYVMADNVESAAHSPHLDPFRARAWEVLYLVDPLDAFLVNSLTEYQGKKLQNVDAAGLELPETEETPEEDSAESAALSDKAFNLFISRCVTTLGRSVLEVRPSKVLTDNPVRLVAPDNQPGHNFERLQRLMRQDYATPQRILEVNRRHPIVVNIARQLEHDPSASIINLTIEQLYESALVQEGLHPNPAAMLTRIQKIMEWASAVQP